MAAVLLAHDTWLLPSSTTVAPGGSVTLAMTSGMEFPAPDVAVKLDRLAGAHCRLAGTIIGISNLHIGDKSLELKLRPERPGIATVWAESKPRTLELKPAEVKD